MSWFERVSTPLPAILSLSIPAYFCLFSPLLGAAFRGYGTCDKHFVARSTTDRAFTKQLKINRELSYRSRPWVKRGGNIIFREAAVSRRTCPVTPRGLLQSVPARIGPLCKFGDPTLPAYLRMNGTHEDNETRQLALVVSFIPVVPPLRTRVALREQARER